jgi:type I restriction enzyme S subunit
MSDRTVSFSELASEGLIEVGAGRPRSVLDQYPSIPILRVADVLDGRIESPSQDCAPGDYRKIIGSKISKPGDIVLTVKGTVGRVALMPPNGPVFAYSPQLCYFRPTASGPLRSRYLYYWFKSAQFWNQADALKGQTDMADYLSLSDVQTLKIRIPSLGRQDDVIEILGSLDDKIDVNDQITRTGQSLSACLAADELWAGAVSLGDIVTLCRRQVAPEEFSGSVVAHYSLPAFDAGNMPELVSSNTIKSNKFVVDGPSILLSKLNPSMPRIWSVVPDSGIPALASTEFLVLSPIDGISPDEVWAVCSQPSFIGKLVGMATGTSNSHQRVMPADLLASHVVDPRSIASVERQVINSLMAKTRKARVESRALEQLRDMLLPKLMSGEIRVRDAEKVVEEVT